jgi:predicted transporter
MLYEILILLILIFNLIDLSATLWLLENGLAIEANPFMQETLNLGTGFFIIIKLFLVFGGVYILRKNKNRKAAKAAIWAAFITYSILMLYFLFNICITL